LNLNKWRVVAIVLVMVIATGVVAGCFKQKQADQNPPPASGGGGSGYGTQNSPPGGYGPRNGPPNGYPNGEGPGRPGPNLAREKEG